MSEMATHSRRAALGALASVPALAILPAAAGALSAVPAGTFAAGLGQEPDLQSLIASWHETHSRLEETYAAYDAAHDRARCPVPQALIAAESDTGHWCGAPDAGKRYDESDVNQLRKWLSWSSRPKGPFPNHAFPDGEFDDRANEIITSWDNWQAEQKAADEREGVDKLRASWRQEVENYRATGWRVAMLKAKTMAGVIAKLLAAAPTSRRTS